MSIVSFPNRQWALLLSLTLSVFVALIAFAYISFVFGRVEYVKAAHFAIEAEETSQTFGNVVTLKPRFRGASITWDSRNGTNGTYVFYIVGDIDEGSIRIKWHRKGNLSTFSVTDYQVLERE